MRFLKENDITVEMLEEAAAFSSEHCYVDCSDEEMIRSSYGVGMDAEWMRRACLNFRDQYRDIRAYDPGLGE